MCHVEVGTWQTVSGYCWCQIRGYDVILNMMFLVWRCCGRHGANPLIMQHVATVHDVLLRRFFIYPPALETNEHVTCVLHRGCSTGDLFSVMTASSAATIPVWCFIFHRGMLANEGRPRGFCGWWLWRYVLLVVVTSGHWMLALWHPRCFYRRHL
jgi:hypothetical protein